MQVNLRIRFKTPAGEREIDVMTEVVITFLDPRLVALVGDGNITLEPSAKVNLTLKDQATREHINEIAQIGYGYEPRNLKKTEAGDPLSPSQLQDRLDALGRAGLTEKQFEGLCKRCDEIDFSVRAHNCLQNAGFKFIWQIAERDDLLKIKNLGVRWQNEIRDLIHDNFKLHIGIKDQIEMIRRFLPT